MSKSFFKLYYHLVWSTKCREPIITPSIEKMLLECSSHFINLNLGNKKQHHACGNVLGVLEYTPLDEPNQPRDLSLGGDESTGDLPPNPIYGVYGCARSCFFG